MRRAVIAVLAHLGGGGRAHSHAVNNGKGTVYLDIDEKQTRRQRARVTSRTGSAPPRPPRRGSQIRLARFGGAGRGSGSAVTARSVGGQSHHAATHTPQCEPQAKLATWPVTKFWRKTKQNKKNLKK